MSTSTITTTNAILSTPGEILQEEFMEPYKISAYRLSKATGLSQTAIGEIIHGERAITMRTAYLFGKAFGTSAEFWYNLQKDYDMLSFDPTGIDAQPVV